MKLTGNSASVDNSFIADELGNIKTKVHRIANQFEGICLGLQISLTGTNGSIVCRAGFAQVPCIRKRTVNNGVVMVSCRKRGCKKRCNVIRNKKNSDNDPINTGKTSAICPDDFVCTCSCK